MALQSAALVNVVVGYGALAVLLVRANRCSIRTIPKVKGSNPIYYRAVRGVGGALPRTSRIGGVRAAEQCADGPRGVPPPRHRRRGCRVRPRALSSASTHTLWRARRDCGRTAASYSQRPDGERSIAEPSGGAAVAGRGKLAQLPLDTRGGPGGAPFSASRPSRRRRRVMLAPPMCLDLRYSFEGIILGFASGSKR